MKKTINKAFTLVELLVVITILSIISVVAYQNFGGAVDKAVSGRKISDISTIETALQQYKADKNYFPAVDANSSTNMWGYTGSTIAKPSNSIRVTMTGQEIETIVSADGGGKVFGSGSLGVIGSKGTISQKTLGKKYLTKDLYDPELGDIKINNIGGGTSGKMIDKGIGRYVYAIYKKGSNNTRGNDYNIAYTIKKDESDKYITKISGTYDKESCYDDKNNCPVTLIGSGSVVLDEGDEQILSAGVINTTIANQGIPYAVGDFTY